MLKLILGTNWRANRDRIFSLLGEDMRRGLGGRVLLAPEQVSHDYERRLCRAAGDSASRYGEVLSFTRLASRVFSVHGGGAEPVLDGGGRLLAMAAAVQQLAPRLKAYGAVGTRPEFLSALVTAVDEFKSCRVTPDTLLLASARTEGGLAQKLEELALVLEGYNGVCSRFGDDPRDRMTQLLEQLELGRFGEGRVFYVDGFSDFTAQELAVLEELLVQSECVTVSLVCDEPKSSLEGMELAGETAAALIRKAERVHVPVRLETLADPEKDSPLSYVRTGLLSGPVGRNPALDDCVSAVRLGSVWEECVYAAGKIRELVQSGKRYRDCAIVCAQPERYTPVLRQLLHQYEIPAFFAGNEDILHKSVIYTVITALEAVTEGMDRENVLRYLKSVLSPLDSADCDALENYAIAWRIHGKAWSEPFTKNPERLSREQTEEEAERLSRLEASRKLGVEPLLRLDASLRRAKNTLEMLRGLFDFLERVELSRRLEELTVRFEELGDARSAREQEQLWDILVGAMEQMGQLLGQTTQTPDQFLRLLRLLLSQYSVGVIPQALDSVTVGGIPAMRRQEAKHLFLLGAQEGSLPAGSSGGMVLTEQERRSLMDLGVPLRADLYRQLQQELGGILAVCGGASRTFTMTVSVGQGAYAFRRLCRMLGCDPERETPLPLVYRMPDAWAAGAQYVRAGSPAPGSVSDVQKRLEAQASYRLGSLEPGTVRSLYGSTMTLSASQVDKAASCRFAYFMHYGLRLKERREITVDPAQFGTFVHEVLEKTVNEVRQKGGFHTVSLEDTMEIAMKHADQYRREVFADLDGTSQRSDYLFRRNLEELEIVVRELWEELVQSRFQPAGCEVHFGGDHGDMPYVPIPNDAMPARIQGYVDRLDLYEKDGKTYVRVVDYKTGSKSFDFCDVLNGIGLQMLIYLFALEDQGEAYLGTRAEGAGVLYFPARSPVLSVSGPEKADQAQKDHQSNAQRKGLVLDREDILQAMDSTPDRHILPKTPDFGASPEQLRQLKAYVMKTLSGLVERIAGGNVQPDPYWRGDKDACKYCEFSTACHRELWAEPRVFKAENSKSFWAKVEGGADHG